MNHREMSDCKKFVAHLKRYYKFFNEMTAGEGGILGQCLTFIGLNVNSIRENDRNMVEKRREILARRIKLAPAIYKMICLGLNDERAYITKGVKNYISSELPQYLLRGHRATKMFCALQFACIL